MKVVTDFKPEVSGTKYGQDAADFIEAYKANPDVVGAIEVSLLNAKDAAAVEKLLGVEVRAFQQSTLKLGFSAKRVGTRLSKDGTAADLLFTLKPYVKRAAREDVTELDGVADTAE